MDTQLLLEKIAKQGLEQSSTDEMVSLACAYWHENFTPDINRIGHIPYKEQITIGYLTKFFLSFHCVSSVRKRALLDIESKIKLIANPKSMDRDDDEFASEWGMTESINKFIADILPYQTRHYKQAKK